MSAVFQATGANPTGFNANVTNYWILGSAQGSSTPTEANVATVWREAGTFSGMYVNVATNTITANSTFAIRNGGVTGNNSVTYGSTVVGEMFDTTHTDAVAAGNIVNYRFVGGATGTTMQASVGGIIFSPTTTTNTVNKLACTASSGLTDTSVNASYYNPPSGQLTLTTTEANAQFQNQAAATLQNMCVVVTANTASVATVTSRIGAAPGNLTVSISSGATGNLEDTTHTDAPTVGNLFNSRLNSTVTTTFTITNIAMSYLSTANQTHYINGDSAGIAFANNSTNSLVITGRLAGYATESQASVQTGMVFTASMLECYESAATSVPSATLTFRIGAANGNQSVGPMTSGAGTRYTDSTHTDAIAANNEINTRIVLINVPGTNITLSNVGFLATGVTDMLIFLTRRPIFAVLPGRPVIRQKMVPLPISPAPAIFLTAHRIQSKQPYPFARRTFVPLPVSAAPALFMTPRRIRIYAAYPSTRRMMVPLPTAAAPAMFMTRSRQILRVYPITRVRQVPLPASAAPALFMTPRRIQSRQGYPSIRRLLTPLPVSAAAPIFLGRVRTQSRYALLTRRSVIVGTSTVFIGQPIFMTPRRIQTRVNYPSPRRALFPLPIAAAPAIFLRSVRVVPRFSIVTKKSIVVGVSTITVLQPMFLAPRRLQTRVFYPTPRRMLAPLPTAPSQPIRIAPRRIQSRVMYPSPRRALLPIPVAAAPAIFLKRKVIELRTVALTRPRLVALNGPSFPIFLQPRKIQFRPAPPPARRIFVPLPTSPAPAIFLPRKRTELRPVPSTRVRTILIPGQAQPLFLAPRRVQAKPVTFAPRRIFVPLPTAQSAPIFLLRKRVQVQIERYSRRSVVQVPGPFIQGPPIVLQPRRIQSRQYYPAARRTPAWFTQIQNVVIKSIRTVR